MSRTSPTSEKTRAATNHQRRLSSPAAGDRVGGTDEGDESGRLADVLEAGDFLVRATQSPTAKSRATENKTTEGKRSPVHDAGVTDKDPAPSGTKPGQGLRKLASTVLWWIDPEENPAGLVYGTIAVGVVLAAESTRRRHIP